MIHSSTLVREMAAPMQPLRWVTSHAALLDELTLRLARLATGLASSAIALLLPSAAAAQSNIWRSAEIGGGYYVPGIVFETREPGLTVMPAVTSGRPRCNAQQIRVSKAATLTALAHAAKGQGFTQTGMF